MYIYIHTDASCEDLEVDKNLSFLDEYVANALAKGAAPYSPPENLVCNKYMYIYAICSIHIYLSMHMKMHICNKYE
jgi:hypothetical protein